MNTRLFAISLSLLISAQAVKAELVRAQASTCALTKTLKLKDLRDEAGIIFKGKLVSVDYAKEDGLNVKKLHFRVKEALRGVDKNSKQIIIKEWGATKSPLVDNFDQDSYYVFFFYKPSSIGLTSLVGMDQGLVRVNRLGKVKFSSRIKLSQGLSSKLNTAGTDSAINPEITTYNNLKEYLN